MKSSGWLKRPELLKAVATRSINGSSDLALARAYGLNVSTVSLWLKSPQIASVIGKCEWTRLVQARTKRLKGRNRVRPGIPIFDYEGGNRVRCYIKSGANPGSWYRPIYQNIDSIRVNGWPAEHLHSVLYALAFSNLPKIPSDKISSFELDVVRVELQFSHRGQSKRDYERILEKIERFAKSRFTPGEQSKTVQRNNNRYFRTLATIINKYRETPSHKGLEIALMQWHLDIVRANTAITLPRWLNEICNVDSSNNLSSPTNRSYERFARIFWSYKKSPEENSRTAYINRDGSIAHVEAERSGFNTLLKLESYQTESMRHMLQNEDNL